MDEKRCLHTKAICCSRNACASNLKCSLEGNTITQKSRLLNGTVGKNAQLAGPGRLAVKWWGLYDNHANVDQPPPPPNVKYWGTWNMMAVVWLLAVAGVVVASIVCHFFSREHYKHFEDACQHV
eukprot:c39445_g1_i1 orf=5-376(-)